MNYGKLQYRLPYRDDDLDDSVYPENPNSNFEEVSEEAEDEDETEWARRTLKT